MSATQSDSIDRRYRLSGYRFQHLWKYGSALHGMPKAHFSLSPSARLPGLLSLLCMSFVMHVMSRRRAWWDGQSRHKYVYVLSLHLSRFLIRNMLFGNSGAIECCSCLLGTITNTDPAKVRIKSRPSALSSWSLGLEATWRSSKQQKAASSADMFCFPLSHTAQMCNCHCGDNIKTGIKGPRQIYGRIIKVNNEHIAHSTFGSAHRISPS